jgi:hypothetical protein
MKCTGGRERDVMKDDALTTGMQHVQLITDSKPKADISTSFFLQLPLHKHAFLWLNFFTKRFNFP